MYYITYEIHGFDGIQQAGPYSQAEVKEQRDDIAGYEGVYNVHVISVEEMDE